jgi:hypothetical protein
MEKLVLVIFELGEQNNTKENKFDETKYYNFRPIKQLRYYRIKTFKTLGPGNSVAPQFWVAAYRANRLCNHSFT